MPFPYTFPFKFVEFTRYLQITSSLSRLHTITGCWGSDLTVTPSLARGLDITSVWGDALSVTPHIGKGLNVTGKLNAEV